MKGIIIVDIPVDDPVEIDEYGMIADIKIRPMTLTKREDLFFELKNVDIRPMPQKKKLDEDLFLSQNFKLEYARFDGYNKCIDDIIRGEEE